jgi:hypothetical protein
VVLSVYAEPAYTLGLFENGTGRRAYLLKERVRSHEELISATTSYSPSERTKSMSTRSSPSSI